MDCSYSGRKEHHIAVEKGEAGKYVILTGDPGRCESIASHFEEPVQVGSNREFVTWSGSLLGEKISVCSTGIGGPSAAIAMEELIHCGADTFIRVGTAGGMQLDVCGGDLVVATAAIRSEGTSREYAPIEFPAAADWRVTEALRRSAEEKGYTCHTGIVHCKDSFYGQHDPESMPVGDELKMKWNAWIRCGALASEMESAALFTVANIRRVRMGTVLLVAGNQMRRAQKLGDTETYDTESAVKTAIAAMEKLIAEDRSTQSYTQTK